MTVQVTATKTDELRSFYVIHGDAPQIFNALVVLKAESRKFKVIKLILTHFKC